MNAQGTEGRLSQDPPHGMGGCEDLKDYIFKQIEKEIKMNNKAKDILAIFGGSRSGYTVI